MGCERHREPAAEDWAQQLALFGESLRALPHLIEGVSAERLRRLPAPGEWSAHIVVSHLVLDEMNTAVTLRLILTEDCPILPNIDGDNRLCATRFAPLYTDTAAALGVWRALREDNVRLCASLSPDELERVGSAPWRNGEHITFRHYIATRGRHDRAHIEQIRSALQNGALVSGDKMNRRTFLCGLTLGTLITPLAAEAQQPGKLYRIGILSPGGVPDPSVATTPNLVPRHLQELGYVQGRNLVVERRFADGKLERLPALARDLLRLPVDVLVAAGGDATHAAREVTATVPIVMIAGSDPVAQGWVKSLSRPAGNVTGVIIVAETVLAAKRLELIREAVPKAARIAVLAAGGPGAAIQLKEAEKAAAELGVRLVVVEAQGRHYDRAFTTMITERSDALFVLMSPVLTRDRKDIIERAAKYRIPAIYEWREFVEVGGLMSYGGSIIDLTRRAALYVDKILRGAKPADLPVEQATKFELVINLKAAKELGLAIPHSLLLRADQVIDQ